MPPVGGGIRIILGVSIIQHEGEFDASNTHWALLFLSACKTSMKNRRGPSDETPTTAQALAPNACASYFDPNAAPPVDPSTLVIPDAQVSAVRVDKSHALYMLKNFGPSRSQWGCDLL